MKEVKQTKFGKEGNCLEACLASLLNIDIDSIPCFKDEKWNEKLNKWLIINHECYLITITTTNISEILKLMNNSFYIGCGYSSRGLYHATIWKNNQMVFDPHPSDEGIKEIESIDFLVKYFK